MNYFKYSRHLEDVKDILLIRIRDIFDYAKEAVIFLTLGFLLGVSVRSLFTSSEVEQIQKEYKAYQELVDSCFLNPRIILPSDYDLKYREDYYRQIPGEEDFR